MILHAWSSEIIGGAYRVHSALGPGLLESAYTVCLAHELRCNGLSVATNVPLPLKYRELQMANAYKLDLVVEDKIVVEVKAITKVVPVHEAQLLTYLKLGTYPLGLLINFHVLRLRDGIRRFIN